jgi:hypothetical protein
MPEEHREERRAAPPERRVPELGEAGAGAEETPGAHVVSAPIEGPWGAHLEVRVRMNRRSGLFLPGDTIDLRVEIVNRHAQEEAVVRVRAEGRWPIAGSEEWVFPESGSAEEQARSVLRIPPGTVRARRLKRKVAIPPDERPRSATFRVWLENLAGPGSTVPREWTMGVLVDARHCTGILTDLGRIHLEVAGEKRYIPGLKPNGGYPCQGYDYDRLPADHWWCRDPWYLGEHTPQTGFHNALDREGDPLIEVRLQSGYNEGTLELKNAWWFHFRLRIPRGATQTRHRFRLLFRDRGLTNFAIREYGEYHWETFRPVYRFLDRHLKVLVPWRRVPVAPETTDSCIVTIDGAPISREGDIYLELAQTIPFTARHLWHQLNYLERRREEIPEEYEIVVHRGPYVFQPIPGYPEETNHSGLGSRPEHRVPEGQRNVVPAVFMGRREDPRPAVLVFCPHLEPSANWIAVGMMREIVRQLVEGVSPEERYLERASYLFLPMVNVDGHDWGICAVAPENPIDVNGWQAGRSKPRVSWVVFRYVKELLYHRGISFIAELNLHNDYCPRPERWELWQARDPSLPHFKPYSGGIPPMVWGWYKVREDSPTRRERVRRFIRRLGEIQREELGYSIIRDPDDVHQGRAAWQFERQGAGSPFMSPYDRESEPNLTFGFQYVVGMEYPNGALYEDRIRPDGSREYVVRGYFRDRHEMMRHGELLLRALHDPEGGLLASPGGPPERGAQRQGTNSRARASLKKSESGGMKRTRVRKVSGSMSSAKGTYLIWSWSSTLTMQPSRQRSTRARKAPRPSWEPRSTSKAEGGVQRVSNPICLARIRILRPVRSWKRFSTSPASCLQMATSPRIGLPMGSWRLKCSVKRSARPSATQTMP